MKKEKVTNKKFCQAMKCEWLHGNKCERPDADCQFTYKHLVAWEAKERKAK